MIEIVGVHSLDHFTLTVPDLDEAHHFYSVFGLDVRRAGALLHLRTFGSDHVWADIIHGESKQLKAIRFGIYEKDAALFSERLAGIVCNRPDGVKGTGIWVRSPDGLPIELAVVPKSSPDEKAHFALPPRISALRGAAPRHLLGTVKPRRLAHLAIFTSSVPHSIGFFQDNLGLRLSDRSGDGVAFMHGPHGSEHHMIALAGSDGVGLHHSSWDVGSIAEIGQGAMQMQTAGFSSGWGLGRHVLGSNYFYYARDPWGSYAEYSADMDFIPAGTQWQSSDSPAEDSFYQWGPPPPADFSTNYETSQS
ncbi:VOC family protein [Blastomonas fulva]|uniref:VOC family protein n=1 Tax=Blastomonas fulva TaxID=1550728 RepID=UPI0025A32C32|nr:VOC family protein [Blastomonas fulva]MDM7928822.1 VOC family protein [Blastomonas fulva]MDM7964608.1 VOC family protein [Blastomonas fulva]